MASPEERIAQFRQMHQANPKDELAAFSLGRALLDAGKTGEAIAPLTRALELNPDLSRVYQLLAGALLKEGQKQAAIERLTQGAKVAAQRGDFMPRDEMVKMLTELGAPVPAEAAKAAGPANVGQGEVQCSRCGKVGPKMAHPPFNNPQGRIIHEKVCANCWREWIGMGTKVINELRLPLSDPQAQKIFDQHMLEFLNLA